MNKRITPNSTEFSINMITLVGKYVVFYNVAVTVFKVILNNKKWIVHKEIKFSNFYNKRLCLHFTRLSH